MSEISTYKVFIEHESRLKDGRVEMTVSAFRGIMDVPIASIRILSHEETALPFALEALADAIRRPLPERIDTPYVEVPHA